MANSRNPIWILLGLSFVFFLIFLGVSAYVFLGKGDDGAKGARASGRSVFGTKSEGVGILEVNGVIMDSKRVLKNLEDLSNSDAVKAIVLRIDSPGGAVAPSQEIYEALKKEKKPVVASMSSLAASGGYYIACGAKKIFANPGTLTGSIGVRMDFINLKDLYQWAKVKRYTVKAGRYKDSGSDSRDMTPEEKELFQDMIDDVHMQFKQTVATSRNLPLKEVEKIADGRILSGAQAFRSKLVDELGTLDDAIQEASKMAGIKGEPIRYYPEKRRHRLLDWVMEQGDQDEDYDSLAPDKTLGALLGLIKRSSWMPRVLWLWKGSAEI